MAEEQYPLDDQVARDRLSTTEQLTGRWLLLDLFRTHPFGTLVCVVAATVFSVVSGNLTQLSWPATVAVLVSGGLVTWLGMFRPPPRLDSPEYVDARGAAVWGGVLVAFAVWELYAFFKGSTPAHPTLSILSVPLLASPSHRVVGYLIWLAAGMWVVRR
jgi:hypothetical protein